MLGDYFEAVTAPFKSDKDLSAQAGKIKLASNYITSDIVAHMKAKQDFTLPSAGSFTELINMISLGKISSRGAKELLAYMHGDESPEKIANEKGLIQKSDEGELKAMIEKILGENETVVAEYKQGKESVLQYLVGQAMKVSKGAGNPVVIKKILLELLSK